MSWNVGHINRGLYFYGFSHTPFHKLNLPDRTFTISYFRDPIERLLSHYNMLVEMRHTNIDHPCMEVEGLWLGDGLDCFLRRIPKEHLLAQLYMFSRHYNIGDALENVQRLGYYFFSDNFNDGVRAINHRTGLQLQPLHVRKTDSQVQVSAAQLTRLRVMLAAEYAFVELIRAAPG